jgi:xanthine/uracil/vitamin C permease (AzgA family)
LARPRRRGTGDSIGIAFGLIAYAAVQLLAGRMPRPAMGVLALLFLCKFAVL